MKSIVPTLALCLALALASGCSNASSPVNGTNNNEESALQQPDGNGASDPPAEADGPDSEDGGSDPTNDADGENGSNAAPDDAAPSQEADAEGDEADSNNSDTPAVEEQPAEPQYKMNSVYRFEPVGDQITDKKVLLTFDDGPKEQALIDQIIDALDKHDAKAIFFVNGYRVEANPELLELIHERGQTIGNHSWDHVNLKEQSASDAEAQIDRVQEQVSAIIGETPRFFRPPFGAGNDQVKAHVKDQGMLYMTWSNGSLDWDSSAKDKPDEVIKNVLEQLHSGANILMHELPWTADALDELLTKLEAEGYGFIDPATIDLSDLESDSEA
ncbi:polysaccharide deacetylase family protein [Paenibacillus sp. IB182496]|uniref:Polysaccharide deacetylase family protein n=1 Tax=Paenibacillus sabuli TaxID=2772509 RepID=A0A927BSY3_9BACL|nr:polysaccharide deacetylase family protein [Paenibacillus sabuli]MBD2845195.1 polysaccharide deacetylase family protein [Paenibacillus sabuli]